MSIHADRRRAAGCLAAAAIFFATAATVLGAPATPRVAPTQQLAVLNHDSEAFATASVRAHSAGEINEVRPITGERTVLPVIATSDPGGVSWLQVLLPGRPDGHSGWIQAASVTQTATAWSIVVELSIRTVFVFYDGRLERRFAAVVGKPSTPTPTGNFFVEETVPLASTLAGAPFALALSARSNALRQFDGGPGQVALHGVAGIGGTPGTAVSHGCVRLSTADIVWLGTHISSGVPVRVQQGASS
jgi:lipoprotein-anchoring transpeptidase ErfK/SrfK